MIPKLGRVERVDVRVAWPNEASSFTPWLASEEGLELLQEALGMDLEVEATEQFVGPFKADIVAKRTDTPEEHWVLIENQLERTDHRHLGQLLTYAAGLKAATIVWVAREFAEEHRAALDWLNEITPETIAFYGLEVELWRIGSSTPAPMFNVIAQPNEWAREVQHVAAGTFSDLERQRLGYWEAVQQAIRDRKGPLSPLKATTRDWLRYGIGRTGAWLAAGIGDRGKKLWVELGIEGPPGKLWFDALAVQKEAIERDIGEAVTWQRMDGKKMARIVIYLEGVDIFNEEDWPRQIDWQVRQLEAFHRAFRQRVPALPAGPAGGVEEGDLDGPGEP